MVGTVAGADGSAESLGRDALSVASEGRLAGALVIAAVLNALDVECAVEVQAVATISTDASAAVMPLTAATLVGIS
jgi:hypothetical protein